MIQTVQAVQFHRFMGAGRSSPALCGCDDQAGQHAGEFVVKLRGGMERGPAALVCELVASQIASYFGIAVPPPAFVSTDEAFAGLVAAMHPAKADRMKKSIGLNFGSRQLSDVTTWPVDRAIPDAMWQTAVSIFAFDALIQNPDRRFNNPNLFSRGDQIVVFDHELAFSFVEDILPAESPWLLGGHRYLADHVFFKRLKSKEVDLAAFTASLAALPDIVLPRIVADVPPEWKNGSLSKIERHLCTVAGRSSQFAEEIRRRLA